MPPHDHEQRRSKHDSVNANVEYARIQVGWVKVCCIASPPEARTRCAGAKYTTSVEWVRILMATNDHSSQKEAGRISTPLMDISLILCRRRYATVRSVDEG